MIFPAAQVARKNDLYLFCCGAGHKVAPQGRYVAFLSTTVETSVEGESAQATAMRELAAGLQMLGNATRIFYDVTDLMKPAKDGTADKDEIPMLEELTRQKVKEDLASDQAAYKTLLKDLLLQGLIKLMESTIVIRCREQDVGLIEEVMERGGVTDRRAVAWAGAGFECAIVLGGIFLGKYVDGTKKYKKVTS